MQKPELEELARKITEGIITPREMELLENWYNSQPPAELEWHSAVNAAVLKQRIQLSLLQKINEESRVIRMPRKNIWWRVAAAVAVLLVLAASLWFFMKSDDKERLADSPFTERYKNEISPAAGSVFLKMDNGIEMGLDSIREGGGISGVISAKGNPPSVIATKSENALTYLSSNKILRYQTIFTGKGKDFRLVLPDGTKVWLDAQSSILFPSVFNGNKREVTVTGQAYFEVARNPSQPFIVRTGDQQVQVLGTHFNINGFGKSITTTLFEGIVAINSGNETLQLLPGQQASSFDTGLKIGLNPDLEEVLAWKDGRFYFDGASIESIMEQIGRWYDIKVSYQDRIQEKFVAKVPRDLPLSRLLQLLEMTKQVAFSVNGKEITVMRP